MIIALESGGNSCYNERIDRYGVAARKRSLKYVAADLHTIMNALKHHERKSEQDHVYFIGSCLPGFGNHSGL